MAQLILSNRPGATGEVLAVLADGVYPGFKVVENQDPILGWNSRPKPKFRCIHVPSVDVAAFDDLMVRDEDPVTGDSLSDASRALVIDFLPAQALEMAAERTIMLPNAVAVRRKRNPRAS